MTPEERQAIDARLDAYNGQLAEATAQLDYSSLDRAADLAARFEDKSWVEELPALEKPKVRGRPVDPASRARFNQWLRDKRGWKLVASTSGRLLRTRDFARIYGDSVTINRLTGEGALRPFYRLERLGFNDRVVEVFERATRAAGEGPITSEHTRAAVRDFIAEQPKEEKARATGRRIATDIETKFEQAFEQLNALAFLGPDALPYLERVEAWARKQRERLAADAKALGQRKAS